MISKKELDTMMERINNLENVDKLNYEVQTGDAFLSFKRSVSGSCVTKHLCELRTAFTAVCAWQQEEAPK